MKSKEIRTEKPIKEMEKVSITSKTLERVLCLLPTDGTGIRWKYLVKTCTGPKANPDKKMSKETLSNGLKSLIELGIVKKEPVLMDNGTVSVYQRIMNNEIAKYTIFLSVEEANKISHRYAELEAAKEWMIEHGCSDPDNEIEKRLSERTNDVVTEEVDEDDEWIIKTLEDPAQKYKDGDIVVYEGIVGDKM